jgi:hypothetical protein
MLDLRERQLSVSTDIATSALRHAAAGEFRPKEDP